MGEEHGGKAHDVEADEEALVVAAGHGAVDRGGPDANGEGDRSFEDVKGEAVAVEGRLVVVERPAAVVVGDGVHYGFGG